MIDHIVELLRIFSGGSGHFDEPAARTLVASELDRTVNIASSVAPGRQVATRSRSVSSVHACAAGASTESFHKHRRDYRRTHAHHT